MPRDWRHVQTPEALLQWARDAAQAAQRINIADEYSWASAAEYDLLIHVAGTILDSDVSALFRPLDSGRLQSPREMDSRVRDSLFWRIRTSLQQLQDYLETRIAANRLAAVAPDHAVSGNQP